MTQSPEFTDPQFVDANGVGGLNAAFGTVSGAIAAAGSGTWAIPGLIAPEAMTVSFSSLVATIGLPQPWGLVSSGGVLLHAHGTQTGADTHSYSVDFTSVVPSVGSVTGYLVATPASIQQNPFPIPGPPPGHPSYNPNFVPTIGYATNVGSVSLSATSGAPDNITTFELLRTNLVAGQSSITSWTTGRQNRAVNRVGLTGIPISAGGALTPAQAQGVLYATASGLTSTLPPASGANGLVYRFNNTTGGPWTIAAAGSDSFQGYTVGGYTSVTVPSPGQLEVWSYGAVGVWSVAAVSPTASMLFASFTAPVSSSTSITQAQAGSYLVIGGTSTTQTLASASSVDGATFGFYAASACTVAIAGGGGTFQGGALSGSTSVALSASDWLFVQSDGTNYHVISASPDIISVHGMQAFSADAYFTVPNGVGHVKAICTGGGGGGAGFSAATNAGQMSGGGGGAGGTAVGNYAVTAGASIACTIGGGGTADGGNGGSSSFGSFCSATGGSGATVSGISSAGGIAGTGSGGTINLTGGPGGDGQDGTTVQSGIGGASYWGGGGRSGSPTGVSGAAPGSGGGGAYSNGTFSSGTGGTGANGIIVVEW